MRHFPIEMPARPNDFEAPDLQELLRFKGLLRWHGPLLTLTARYEGWLSHYEFDPALDPDLRPIMEVMAVVAGLPQKLYGDDVQLAAALGGGCDFLSRQAVDRTSQVRWDPLAQSYREFLQSHPGGEPMWSTEPPWAALELVGWMVAQSAQHAPPAGWQSPSTGRA